MSAILTTFGIDWHLLLINAVNFGLLLAGLTYFLYKPVMRMLAERRDVVAKGVEAAQDAQEKLREVEESRTTKLAEAGREADALVASARASAAQKERDIVAAGEANAATIIKEAELEAKDIKERALAQSKQEVAKLIVLGIEKSLVK